MTADELRKRFNSEFGLDKEWPKTLLVDYETYANCCQDIFDKSKTELNSHGHRHAKICLGRNKGIMFKNVELILRKT